MTIDDARIEYKFETDRTNLKLKETANGQVDFKELNLIQNVVAGQPLAVKILAQRGKGGKTITGRYLEARNGKDIPIPLGQNTVLDKDGRTVLAEKSGHVMLMADKITVEEVYEVPGVNIKTGNITYMGTVVCRGNVDDGFNIKASGNIENSRRNQLILLIIKFNLSCISIYLIIIWNTTAKHIIIISFIIIIKKFYS